MTMRRSGLVVVFALAMLVGVASAVHASGYHPPFDRAVKEADWIVLHEVVSDHKPKDKLIGIPKAIGRFAGRVFLVRVKRSFKGPFRKGDLFYIWDRSDRSSASYFLRKGRDNLTFLIKPKRRKFIAGVGVRGGAMDLAVPIRNLTGAFGKGRALHVNGWLGMLKLTRTGTRPIPLVDMRRVLGSSTSPALLRYVLTHWTGALNQRDVRLVKSLIGRPGAKAMVTSAALELLRKKGIGLSVSALRRQLANGPKYSRDRMLRQVNRGNAVHVRDALWRWIQRDEQSALGAIKTLARHQRRYLVNKLRRNRLPFWLEIPALQEVGNKVRRGYSASAMKLNRWQLVAAGKLVKGKTFGAAYSFQTRKPLWAELIKLVMPLLPNMKRGPRELAIAIAHTWGYQVRRKGNSAKLGARGRPPLTVTIRRVPGARYKFMIVEHAASAVMVCTKSSKRIAIAQGRSGVTSMDSTMGGWQNTNASRKCFKRRSGVVHTEIVDISSLVKNVKTPGTYELSVDLLHSHSGSEHGLAGWTGMLYSNRLRILLP